MILTESQLRRIIRKILIERKSEKEREDGRHIIGEPDATNEPERDNPQIDQAEEDEVDEVSTVGGIAGGGGNIRGYVLPMSGRDEK